MTRRGWILALGAGLCGGLPACQTPLGKSALERDEIVAAPADPQPKAATAEPSSPYAEIPHQEKRDYSAKGMAQAEDSGPVSPYSSLSHPTTSGTATKAAAISAEAKLDSLLAVVKKPAPTVPVDPPPPDPPTWNVDMPSPTPYVASRNQPPLPTPQFNLVSTVKKNSVSPYAAPANQYLVAALNQIPTSDSGLTSPYPTISSQVGRNPVGRTPVRNSESLSPYAEVPNALPAPLMDISARASHATSERATSQAPAIKNDNDTPASRVDSPPKIQQTNFPREDLNFHNIDETPAASGPEADLGLPNDSSASSADLPISRKEDEPPIGKALYAFLCKRPEEAVKWIKRYDEPNQELILRILPLIARIPDRDLTRADAEKGIAILEEFGNVIGLPTTGELAIGKLCLCKRIKTFGDYEPFSEDHQFQPRDLVWIYAEVRNFTTKHLDLGNGEMVYETRLMTTARITNAAGTREWPLPFDRPFGPDRSRSLRRDYWDNLSFNVPDLPPGSYTLWLKVVDEPTGRFKDRPVDFQVVPARGS